jgi:hypothetical protein
MKGTHSFSVCLALGHGGWIRAIVRCWRCARGPSGSASKLLPSRQPSGQAGGHGVALRGPVATDAGVSLHGCGPNEEGKNCGGDNLRGSY